MGFVAPGKRFRRKRKGDRPAAWEKLPERELAVPLDPSKIRRSTRSRKAVKPTDSILERLPHDILWEIFLLSGIDNGLPLTSKYFHRELHAPRLVDGDPEDVVQNKWLYLKVLRQCLVVNLNAEVETGWAEKYEATLSGTTSPPDLMKRIVAAQLGVPNTIYQEKYAINVNVFKLRFMNNAALSFLRENFPGIKAMDAEEIQKQIESREAYLSWNYKILQEALKQAEQAGEVESEMAIIAEARQKKTVTALDPGLDLKPITQIASTFYSKLDFSKAMMIKNLVKHCSCALENEVDFQKQCFDQLPFESFHELADIELQRPRYSFEDFKSLAERIIKVEESLNIEDQSSADLNLQLLYTSAEIALAKCIIEDHEKLRDLAWLTSRVQRPDLQRILSTKSLESLQ